MFKVEKFKMDDKVKVMGNKETPQVTMGWGIEHNLPIGSTGKIVKEMDEAGHFDVEVCGHRQYVHKDHLIKMENAMSKYDELKSRIEGVEGWDKEADDILQEMGKEFTLENGISKSAYIEIPTSQIGNIMIFDATKKEIKRFYFSSQCEKLSAFKKALMWLLDHSDIKKTIVGTEVKADIEGKTYKVRILEKL